MNNVMMNIFVLPVGPGASEIVATLHASQESVLILLQSTVHSPFQWVILENAVSSSPPSRQFLPSASQWALLFHLLH